MCKNCIVCGKLEPAVVRTLVRGIADACEAQGCALTGGETSVQPGVVEDGVYILSASAIGVVDKDHIIDGAAIEAGRRGSRARVQRASYQWLHACQGIVEAQARIERSEDTGRLIFSTRLCVPTCAITKPLRIVSRRGVERHSPYHRRRHSGQSLPHSSRDPKRQN